MLNFLTDFLLQVWHLIWRWGWIALPIALVFIFWDLWRTYIAIKYKASLKWVFLEVVVPSDLMTGPKAMEQVFAGLWSTVKFAERFWDTYVKGVFQEWYIFEIVLKNGKIHFYIRTLKKFRQLVESRIYAQYPEVEIREAEDYYHLLPPRLDEEKYDFWGTEFKFLNNYVYPILTYSYFTDERNKEDRTDPMANILEAFSIFPDSALVVLQYFIRPKKDAEIKAAAKAEVDKLMGIKPPPPKPGGISNFFGFLKEIFLMILGEKPSTESSVSSTTEKPNTLSLSPGTLEKIKAIERKASKYCFDVGIKAFYYDRKENLNKDLTATLISIFHPVNSQGLNSIIVNGNAQTALPKYKFKIMLKDQRLNLRRRRFYRRFVWQSFPYDPLVLNIEELATICRFPSIKVRTPLVEKTQIKTAEPPLELPR